MFSYSPWFQSCWFQTVPHCSCWKRLFGNHCLFRKGLVANGIRLTKRCSALSSRCDVTCGLPYLGNSFTVLVWVCFITGRLTTGIMIAYLTSNSFEGNSCWPHSDYLPFLRLRYSPSYHVHSEWIIFSKHRT
jgi:hypothetical protein